MTPQSATAPANYWRARIEADRASAITRARAVTVPAHDYDDVWFGAGLAGILALALVWFWAPTLEHGSVALGYSLFWTAMWVTIVITAWVDVHRFDRTVTR